MRTIAGACFSLPSPETAIPSMQARDYRGRPLPGALSGHLAAAAFAAPGMPQNMWVPRTVEVTISTAPSLFRSSAMSADPPPERL